MKTKLIGYVLILWVLVGVTASATFSTRQSSQIEGKDKECVREGGARVRGANYVPEQIGWSERIWASGRKRRPYRKRFRGYRIGKKERRQLRRRLRRMAEIADVFCGPEEKESSVSPTGTASLIGASCPSARWG